jgi:hypothetical protein
MSKPENVVETGPDKDQGFTEWYHKEEFLAGQELLVWF